MSESTPFTIAVHEFGHAVEFQGGHARGVASFLEKRTRGEPLVPMSRFGIGYGENERTRPDKFFDPYCGIDYGGLGTEVVSMGTQALAEGRLIELLEQDPDTLFYILGMLLGA